jgi:hypothetical protein
MAEIVNLRLARKAAARRSKEAEAAANRLAHGRTRAEREASRAEAERARRLLDGARREGHD